MQLFSANAGSAPPKFIQSFALRLGPAALNISASYCVFKTQRNQKRSCGRLGELTPEEEMVYLRIITITDWSHGRGKKSTVLPATFLRAKT